MFKCPNCKKKEITLINKFSNKNIVCSNCQCVSRFPVFYFAGFLFVSSIIIQLLNYYNYGIITVISFSFLAFIFFIWLTPLKKLKP